MSIPIKDRSPALLEVGRRLRAAREAAGLSLNQAETQTNVDAVRIGSYERADRGISVKNLIELAAGYDLDPRSFLPDSSVPGVITDEDLAQILRVAADRIQSKGEGR